MSVSMQTMQLLERGIGCDWALETGKWPVVHHDGDGQPRLKQARVIRTVYSITCCWLGQIGTIDTTTIKH